MGVEEENINDMVIVCGRKLAMTARVFTIASAGSWAIELKLISGNMSGLVTSN